MTSARSERERLDAMATPLLARAATVFVGLSGTANVVMQLSRPEVGYGVMDSPVDGARLFDDPVRRRRTTLGQLAVAVHGTASERAAYRKAVNGSHAAVRDAFDPALQLWVGACLFHGFEEASEAVFGPLRAEREAFYQQGVIFGGMLQMPASAWPTSREDFEDEIHPEPKSISYKE